MPSLLRHLSAPERRELLRDIYYLNLAELHGFCREHGVPFRIRMERPDGRHVATRDQDRKLIVIGRVLKYLETGEEQEATLFIRDVVADGEPPSPFGPDDRLLYGWYDKKNEELLSTLRDLTADAFKNGAVARILMNAFWARGEAPTLRVFAEAWLKAEAEGLGVDRGEHPEAAWLTDRARGEVGADWKAKRAAKAREVLRLLGRIPRPD